jgi:hypothetical protein
MGTISGGRFIPNPKFNPDKKPRIPPPEEDAEMHISKRDARILYFKHEA